MSSRNSNDRLRPVGAEADESAALGDLADALSAGAARLSTDSPWQPRIAAFARLLHIAAGLPHLSVVGGRARS